MRNFNPRNASVPDADWLLLASIRNDPSAELMEQMRASRTRYSWGTEEPTATVPMDQVKKMYGGMIAISDDPQADQKPLVHGAA